MASKYQMTSDYKPLRQRIATTLQPNVLLPGLSAGLISGILVIICEIAFAAMIFSGELSMYLSKGIGLTLFGSFLIGIIISVRSSYPGMVGAVQDGPAAILGLVAASVAANMPLSSVPDAVFPTVVAAIAMSTLITGCLFILMGRFRLGNLIRFFPYPVVGGFLAGIGWLLVQAGFGVMTDLSLGWAQIPHIFKIDILIKWVPALIFAGVLLFICQRYSHYLVMPGMILAAILLFYLIVIFTGTPLVDVRSLGWFLGPFPEEALWQPVSLSSLALVEWKVVIGQIGSAVTIFFISFISLLLNSSGLGLIARKDIDLNHELKSTGLANLLAGLGGSPTGYISLSISVLGHKIGANSRLAGLTAAVLCGVALFFGATALSYFPKPVAGCMLLFIGLDFLYAWVWEGWFKLPKTDYLLVLMILIVIGIFGFLQGVGAGVIIAVMIFIVQYSRIDVVKQFLTARNFQSKKERAAPFRWLLAKKGDQVHILKLHGFLFFGTANNLYTRVRRRAYDPSLPPLRFLILDFRLVSGLDSSALNSFQRMRQLAETQGFTLVFTHLAPQTRNQLAQAGLDQEDNSVFRTFPDLDYGTEWCEDRILAIEEADMEESKDIHQGDQRQAIMEATYDEMMASLRQQEAFEMLIHRMKGYLERKEIHEGEHLVRQGDHLNGVYIFEFGEAAAYFELGEGKKVRLWTIGQGDVFGELSLSRDLRASASVVANQWSIIHFLSQDKFKEMEVKDPDMSAEFHKQLVRILGMRLESVTNTTQTMTDY